jgi:agmatine deiminase
MKTPAALGFRMPAEWERHDATWLCWPHNATDWPGKLPVIPWVYAEIVRKLVSGELVRILVNSSLHERAARRVLGRAGVDLDRVEFLRLPTNRGWTRDFGPLFVRRSTPRPELAIVRFRFNGWAKYRDWAKDDRVPERAAARLKLPLFRARATATAAAPFSRPRSACSTRWCRCATPACRARSSRRCSRSSSAP